MRAQLIAIGVSLSLLAVLVFHSRLAALPAAAYEALCEEGKELTVALHSQQISPPGVAPQGSEITTHHLSDALRLFREVKTTMFFGPTSNLSSPVKIDIAFIEGWQHDVPRFIQWIRANNPRAKVFFWNLSFLGLRDVLQFDVDCYFTNSKKMLPLLNWLAPTLHRMIPSPISTRLTVKEPKYRHRVVFIGSQSMSEKDILLEMLNEAIPFGLVIYGEKKWNSTSFKSFYRGPLPMEDLSLLYFSADVVLGCTKDSQKALGMINNRVFDVISQGGAVLLSDYFPELEQVAGSSVFYHRQKGDTTRILETVLKNATLRATAAQQALRVAEQHLSYRDVAGDVLSMYHRLSRDGCVPQDWYSRAEKAAAILADACACTLHTSSRFFLCFSVISTVSTKGSLWQKYCK